MIEYYYQYNDRIITKALFEKKMAGNAEARYGLAIIIRAGGRYCTIPAYQINSPSYRGTK